MSNIVLVTSAIMARENIDRRFTQTLHTIESIFSKIPNSSILLIECSTIELDPKIKSIINKYGVEVIEMFKDPRIHEIKKQSELIEDTGGYIKNLTEIYAINKILNSYDFSEYQRISKLSGRYFLGPSFKWDLNEDNLMTTSILYPSPRFSNMTARQCTYWSFPTQNLEEYKTLFRIIEKWLITGWGSEKEYDIEHGLSLFINQLKIGVNQIHPLGIIGLTDDRVLNIH